MSNKKSDIVVVKNVPGRKTDISDSMWLASLLRIGVLKGSFIPEKRIRQIRELVTLRKSYTRSLADYKRRVHKLFTTANIKIDTVVSDLFGKTGRNLIKHGRSFADLGEKYLLSKSGVHGQSSLLHGLLLSWPDL